MKLGKYEFNSKEQAESKIEGLGTFTDIDGNTYPSHNYAIVKLGYNGDKYMVDVDWKELETQPYGWASYFVDVQGEGIHSFYGINYQENKI